MASSPGILSSPSAANCQNRSATEVALSLPEILDRIFQYIGHRYLIKGFSSVIRVNRQWFDCGTRVIWANIDAGQQLIRVPRHRRHIYAAKISTIRLEVSSMIVYTAELQGLEFSALKYLSIETDYDLVCRAQLTEPYCVPSLISFKFRGPALDTNVLLCLQSKCWRLRDIELHLQSSQITPACLLKVIRNFSFLTNLEFHIHKEDGHPISAELVLHLAQLKTLTHLELTWTLTEHAMQLVAAAASDMRFVPFPALKVFGTSASSAVISMLPSLTRDLNELRVRVKDTGIDVMRHVSNLTTLKYLILEFPPLTNIPAGELMALSALSRLKGLYIRPYDIENLNALESDLSDDDLESLTSHWPDMYELELGMMCNLTSHALISLSHHCRNLSFCYITQALDSHDFFAFDYDYTLFPELQSLELGGLVGVDIMNHLAPHELACLFENHFPQLQTLILGVADEGVQEYFTQTFREWESNGEGRQFGILLLV